MSYLGSLGCRDAECSCCGLCKQPTRMSVTLNTNVPHCIFGWSLKIIILEDTSKPTAAGTQCSHGTEQGKCIISSFISLRSRFPLHCAFIKQAYKCIYKYSSYVKIKTHSNGFTKCINKKIKTSSVNANCHRFKTSYISINCTYMLTAS